MLLIIVTSTRKYVAEGMHVYFFISRNRIENNNPVPFTGDFVQYIAHFNFIVTIVFYCNCVYRYDSASRLCLGIHSSQPKGPGHSLSL
jgi:hypothetical protein